MVKNTSANAGDVKRCSFSPWVGKITWSGDWLPTAVFSPRESHGQRKPGRLEAIGLQKVGSHLTGTHAQERLRAGNSYLECILS